MDFLSHALVGATIGELSPKSINRRQLKGAGMAILPDLANLFTYIYLGIKTKRPIPIAGASDFQNNPWIVNHWTFLPWEISHSFLFWGLLIMPLLIWYRQPKMLGIAYLSHLLLDLPSHTGVWSTVPFYPFNFRVEGWFDAWAWPIENILFAAIIPFLIWQIIATLRRWDWYYLRWPEETSTEY